MSRANSLKAAREELRAVYNEPYRDSHVLALACSIRHLANAIEAGHIEDDGEEEEFEHTRWQTCGEQVAYEAGVREPAQWAAKQAKAWMTGFAYLTSPGMDTAGLVALLHRGPQSRDEYDSVTDANLEGES